MKFTELLKLANSQGVDNVKDFELIRTDLNQLKLARPFVFSYEEAGQIGHAFGKDDIPALPFELCSIELEGDGMIYCAGLGKGDFWIASFIIKEIAPGKYHFYMLGSLDGIKLDVVCFTDSGILYDNLIRITHNFIARLATEQTGICKCNEKVKLKKSKTSLKNNYKIKEYLYVTRNVNNTKTSGNGHPINFTHSFEVRGHWRKIKGTGVNRSGDRTVENATWIRAYIKGDLTQPAVVKTRVVHD